MQKRICVVGNFSGRNAGDAAILGGLLKDVSTAYGPVKFDVPTINTKFVRHSYSKFDVVPVGMMPWHLSIKIFGLPILRSILRSDLVLVTDAILFDRKLFNPLFNYLSTMALVLPLAKAHKIPVVLYNVSLGPARTKLGRSCLCRVLDAADEIILRDAESLGEVPDGGDYDSRIRRGADCALSVRPTSDEIVGRIIKSEDLSPGGRPFITFNVNSYIDVFVRERDQRIGIENFAEMMTSVVNELLRRIESNIVFVVTQPMDMKINDMVLSGIEQKDRIRLISNIKYSYADLAGIFSCAEVHFGMRTHSLILASSVVTPIVGVISTPKNRGYMRSIQQDTRMIEFDVLTSDVLVNRIVETRDNRDAIRAELAPIIEAEKAKAAGAADYLRPYLENTKMN